MDKHTCFSLWDAPSASDVPYTCCSAAVLRGGTVRYISGKESVTTQMRFPLGALSECLLAAALLRMSEAGRLSVYDPVRRYLAEYPFDDCTVLDLLLHTTGCLPCFSVPLLQTDDVPQENDYDLSSMAAVLKRGGSGAPVPCAYDLTFLTVLMERAGGYPIGTLLHTLVFAPLGMNGCTVSADDLSDGTFVMPYDRETDTRMKVVPGAASGGIFAPAEDLVRFLSAILDAEAGRPSPLTLREADFLLRDTGAGRSPGFLCASPSSGVFPDFVSPRCRGAVSGGCFLFLDPGYDTALLFLSDGASLSGRYGGIRSQASYLWSTENPEL